jgi:hypothetical protein
MLSKELQLYNGQRNKNARIVNGTIAEYHFRRSPPEQRKFILDEKVKPFAVSFFRSNPMWHTQYEITYCIGVEKIPSTYLNHAKTNEANNAFFVGFQ